MPSSSLRLVTWNCRSGSVSDRLADLAGLAPDIVFLQECSPTDALPFDGHVLTRRVNLRKAIALATPSRDYVCTSVKPHPTDAGPPAIFAGVSEATDGRIRFTVLGLWAHGPDYASDVCRTLDFHAGLLRRGPAIVMGDLNSGSRLGERQTSTADHECVVNAMADLGLVSVYHAFHRLDHGHETHPTYYHRGDLADPWHIDFCFVPAAWASHITDVRVGGPDEMTTSDHRPVLVTLDLSFLGEHEA